MNNIIFNWLMKITNVKKDNDMYRSSRLYIGATIILLLALTSITMAVAPTEEAINKWRAEGTLEKHIADWNAFKARGGSSPDQNPHINRDILSAASSVAVETIQVPVIMVDFSDKLFSEGPVYGTPAAFDSILFSDKNAGGKINPSGSMTDYFMENSYGKLYITGKVYGPYRMPKTYAWYVGEDNGLSNGGYLAYDAAQAANNDIDYMKYGGDLQVIYGLIVLHPGVGGETGDNTAIWSHKSSVAGNAYFDSVVIATYTVLPEEYNGTLHPIGTFCHEHGHILGLPDLYDTQYHQGSEGLGGWSLMASGNYNGNNRYPAHLDAWSKIQLGFIPNTSVIKVVSNLHNVEIPRVEDNPVVYKIASGTSGASEYWLIENRQQFGSDQGLPGSGLCIYHIDPLVSGNNNPAHYGVALEQADGLNGLAVGGSRGDAGDPWPGSSDNRNFTDISVPNSKTYVGATTEIGVWNISNSGSLMYADLDKSFSRPIISFYGSDSIRFRDSLDGNGDMVIEPGETIELFCHIKNTLRDAFGWSMGLETDNPDIEFIDNPVRQSIGNLLMRSVGDKVADTPIKFKIKEGSLSKVSNFTLTIYADSNYHPIGSTPDETYRKQFTFKLAVGSPNILIVDDDQGLSYDSVYSTALWALGSPTRVWNKTTKGSPTANYLTQFTSIFWVHGTKPTGILSANDITALKAFLNNGGNLAMASVSAAAQLATLDSEFMRDYLHARFVDSVASGWVFFGVNGGHLGDSLKYVYDGNLNTTLYNEIKRSSTIIPVEPGLKAFSMSNKRAGGAFAGKYAGVTYEGAYKTVFLTFGPEFLSSVDGAAGFKPKDSLLKAILDFFAGYVTSVDDPIDKTLPTDFGLKQNYPNPFNPSTVIAYTINAPKNTRNRSNVNLVVYNLLGERVKTLVDDTRSPGTYQVTWDGTNSHGNKVASGIYLYRLSYDGKNETKKMVLLK
jgi:M6 family metalloprotease-like protein